MHLPRRTKAGTFGGIFFINLQIIFFIIFSLFPSTVRAEDILSAPLPEVGAMVKLSPAYKPAILTGIIIHPENGLKFDFLIDKGDSDLPENKRPDEYTKLIKYFLASLTVPDEDQWVNLSPHEHDRIIKDNFGNTDMGRDLLAQDYLLKQITASMIYPDSELGKSFWNKVRERALKEFGDANIPVDTFNKVWIIPDRAKVYESGNVAVIADSHLKVMLEEDYMSLKAHEGITALPDGPHQMASRVVKEIVLPELEKEINEGKNFAKVRQVLSAMILATWFKRSLKETLIGKIYMDKSRIKGFDNDPAENEQIYQRYLAALKKGVFNFIKEEEDPETQESLPRKYFSGGFKHTLDEVEKIVFVGSSTITEKVRNGSIQVAVSLATAALTAALLAPGTSQAQTEEAPSQNVQQSAVNNDTGPAIDDLIRQRQRLRGENELLTRRLANGNIAPQSWGTHLGVVYDSTLQKMGNYSSLTGNFELGFGVEGPVGDNGSVSFTLRKGRFGGDKNQIVGQSDYSSIDLSGNYNGNWRAGLDLSLTKAHLSSWRSPEFDDWGPLATPKFTGDNALQTQIGLALTAHAGIPFNFSDNLVFVTYGALHGWVATSRPNVQNENPATQTSAITPAPAANVSTSGGVVLNYNLAPGVNVQANFGTVFDISHLNYQLKLGPIRVENYFGTSFTKEDYDRIFSIQLHEAFRLIDIERSVAVTFGDTQKTFRVGYDVLDSRVPVLLSTRSASLEASYVVGPGVKLVANFSQQTNWSPLTSPYMIRGAFIGVNLNTMYGRNLVTLNIGKGYYNNTQGIDDSAAARLAAQGTQTARSFSYFLTHPEYSKNIMLHPSNFDSQTYFLAQTSQLLINAVSNSNSNEEFINNLANSLKKFNLTSEQMRSRIILISGAIMGNLGSQSMADGKERNVSDEEIYNALRDGFKASINGQKLRQSVVGSGGAAEYIAEVSMRLSQSVKAGLNIFPSGVLVPIDDKGNFSNGGMLVVAGPDGITFIAPGWIFQTKAKTLEEARPLLGRALGIPSYYLEVATPQGRHLGYRLLDEGREFLSRTLHYFGDMSDRIAASYQDYARARQRINENQSQIDRLNELLRFKWGAKSMSDSLKSPVPGTPVSQPAESSQPGKKEQVGGIDMNSANLDLLIKKDSKGSALPLDQQNLALFEKVPGLIPHIDEIKPVNLTPYLQNP